ncbi:MAG TPA: glycoside hydrolase family 3 C-terminal domain-containing protein [Opitutaceae bacterium]|jgi:beta-glucosidase|nr:glycoside hydrolase family 3 C-terminal domain-containing protein [Opitutaceae bacterium]
MRFPSLLPCSAAVLLLASALVAKAAETPKYLDKALPVEARIDDLMSRMTLDEKVGLVHANGLFRSGGVDRLGVPYLWTDDGPQGVREEVGLTSWSPIGRTDDFATALPPGLTLAATWDTELAAACGRVIGEEACIRGKNVILGPGINIIRTPLCGRNYDYYGEDPWLSGRIAVGYIQGMQAEDTVACVKHFALNNQEKDRGSIDVDVSERALREIYLPAFEASIKEGGAMAIMAAYNRVRGSFCAQNEMLLDGILKGEWGFKGGVISDWGGTHDTALAVTHGLDLEMGSRGKYEDFHMAKDFKEGLKNGTFPMALLDDKVRRDLRMLFASGAVDGRKPGSINTPEHLKVARQIAEEGIVLLKNDNALLPIDTAKIHSVAVIGEDAVRKFAAGAGSAGVKAFREITSLDGILARAGKTMNVTYSEGYRQPEVHFAAKADNAGVRRMEINEASPEEAKALADRAVDAAKSSDLVIFVGGLMHRARADDEGSDRADLSLPAHQAELIARIEAANPRTVVVLIAGSPLDMAPWLGATPSVLQAWYGGSEAGSALAAVLFGDVSPSGKLPCTFPRSMADTPTQQGGPRAYPGVAGVVHYDEGLLVGYRWYDTKKIEPLFPFGFGLSYTTFAYSNLVATSTGADSATVKCDVRNSGSREATEVVQLYIHDGHASVERPEKELKGFARVKLAPGETKTVSMDLNARSFAFYSPEKKAWSVEPGSFSILVGSSSRDIRATTDLVVAAAATVN